MADGEVTVVTLRSDFLRDGHQKIVFILSIFIIIIALLTSVSIYLYFDKPAPVIFNVDNNWRVISQAPLNQEYMSHADLVEWVSAAMPTVLSYDFANYPQQFKRAQQYFTSVGWVKMQQQLNSYINYASLQTNKLWVSAVLGGAATIIDQGLLPDHRYAWRLQIPINLRYVGYNVDYNVPVQVSVLIVRIPIIDNLDGVSIEDITINNNANLSRSVNG